MGELRLHDWHRVVAALAVTEVVAPPERTRGVARGTLARAALVAQSARVARPRRAWRHERRRPLARAIRLAGGRALNPKCLDEHAPRLEGQARGQAGQLR